jgi:hypothetical protein
VPGDEAGGGVGCASSDVGESDHAIVAVILNVVKDPRVSFAEAIESCGATGEIRGFFGYASE